MRKKYGNSVKSRKIFKYKYKYKYYKKIFWIKVILFEKMYLLILSVDLEWHRQGQDKVKLNFLDVTYFLLHILIVLVETFSEYYNKSSFD